MNIPEHLQHHPYLEDVELTEEEEEARQNAMDMDDDNQLTAHLENI